MADRENVRAKVFEQYRAEAEKYWALCDDEHNVDNSFYEEHLEPQRDVLVSLIPGVRRAAKELGIRTTGNVLLPSHYSSQWVTRDFLVGVYDRDTPRRDVKDFLISAIAEARLPSSLARPTAAVVGTKILIGHGHSEVWRALKDHLKDDLGLDPVEYNSVPTAGMARKDRLKQMLDEAAIAFLVATAEDEVDDEVRARQNVVHEIGLCQGRLGFLKAIIVHEEGCTLFSNADGLDDIRFPKGKISAAYHEVDRILNREKLLK